MDHFVWLRVSILCIVGGLLVAAWKWSAIPTAELHDITAWLEPHRHAWYALPMVMLAFVALSLFPVLLLITATGIVFGPLLGPLYAMAGSLASGSVGFAIGRLMGPGRIERFGGARIARVSRTLKRNGTLAVFLVRKVPLPFILANVVIGASSVAYRDFVIGTLLGMTAITIALAGFGAQALQVFRQGSSTAWIGAALFVGVPLTLAWLINRALGTRAVD